MTYYEEEVGKKWEDLIGKTINIELLKKFNDKRKVVINTNVLGLKYTLESKHPIEVDNYTKNSSDEVCHIEVRGRDNYDWFRIYIKYKKGGHTCISSYYNSPYIEESIRFRRVNASTDGG